MNNNTFPTAEIKGSPSNGRVNFISNRYLSEPIYIDCEYIKHCTEAHKITDGLNVLQRRAENHAYAIENLTPVIREGEIIVGSKTRFVRGAIPFCNYAS
jgi:formate C-acetyltransferase/4-hydroxyphenylacetate decarboxylase large subunit